MKSVSLAVMALVSTTQAIRMKTPDGSPVYPLEFHFNEDPHSVPDPIAGKKYMTSTQAKLIHNEQFQTAVEPAYIPPQNNPYAPEPVYAFKHHYKYNLADPNPEGFARMYPAYAAPGAESFMQTNSDLKWQVTPDLGELDDHSTLLREWDNPDYLSAMKPKFSGWTNPLSWTDSGSDDDVVLFQMKSKIRFDESGFDTPADKGLGDEQVVNFVQLRVHDDDED